MISTRVIIRVAALAAAATIAVPAAQAGVPPTKSFPKVFFNSVKAGPAASAHPVIAVGRITLNNSQLIALSCENAVASVVYNEFTEGTEKGFQKSNGYTTYACEGGGCTVTNTKGEEVEATYLTAEAPPIAVGTEAHETGISSLPWTGELIERETGKRQVLTHHVKLWMVIPPEPPGKGGGCIGVESRSKIRKATAKKKEVSNSRRSG
jgi:hypothetical protein